MSPKVRSVVSGGDCERLREWRGRGRAGTSLSDVTTISESRHRQIVRPSFGPRATPALRRPGDPPRAARVPPPGHCLGAQSS